MGEEHEKSTASQPTIKQKRKPPDLSAHQWKPGQSGNPAGRPSYRKKFEEAFGRAVEANTESITKTLTKMAREGDSRMMALLLERVIPKVERHEFDAGAAPSKIVLEFAKPDTGGSDGEGND